MDHRTVSIRTALSPLCYQDFHCLAGACRNTCCGGWEIAFNKKDYLRIKRLAQSRELNDILSGGMSRLRNTAFDGFYAHFTMDEEYRCRFQTAEGLCRLQLECGEAALPYVCRIYPRKSLYTSAGKELSLSPSCEAVLALLWDLPQGIDFLEEPLPKQEWKTVTVLPGYERFADIRSFCIDVLQEQSLPLSRRILLLGLLLQRLRNVDLAEEQAVDGWLAWGADQLHSPAIAATLEQMPRARMEFLLGNLPVLLELFQNDAATAGTCRELLAALSGGQLPGGTDHPDKLSIDTGHYQALEDRLEALLEQADHFFENLMVITAFYLAFPLLADSEELWKSYVELCMLYSFFRFAAVCGCDREASRERLFHVLSAVSRGLLHNDARRAQLLNARLENGSATLAHMAILLGG